MNTLANVIALNWVKYEVEKKFPGLPNIICKNADYFVFIKKNKHMRIFLGGKYVKYEKYDFSSVLRTFKNCSILNLNLWFSDFFRDYRKRPLKSNELNKVLNV